MHWPVDVSLLLIVELVDDIVKLSIRYIVNQ